MKRSKTRPAANLPAPKRSGFSEVSMARLSELLAEDQSAGVIPLRPFQAPALPPGVLPKGKTSLLAMDSAAQGYGWLNAQGGTMCGLGFPGYPYLANLTQRSEYRAPIETIAGEMTREWIEFTGADDAKTKELERAFIDFQVRDCVREALLSDGAFGRGQIFIDIKGQNTPERRKLPLLIDPATIKKGSLVGFKSVEPIWTTPAAYNSIDPTAPDFYQPTAWFILGRETHHSRLLTFVSRPVPDILKPSYNFSGMSLSQLIEPYVNRWLKTVDSVNRLISNYSINGVKTNLMSMLAEDDTATSLVRRVQTFNKLRDNRGLMLLDKDAEEFFQFNVPLAGLSELQAQAQEHMAAPTHIPLVKLTGITPSGLNASSEGEIKVFYDFIASEQENDVTHHLTKMLHIVQLHLWGKIDPDIGFQWVPLDSPTDKEMSEMRAADASAGMAYVTGGIVSADEERERLRLDPNSGYTFLEGNAPEPPKLEEGEDPDPEPAQE